MSEQPREHTGRFAAKNGTQPDDGVGIAMAVRENLGALLDDVEASLARATRSGRAAFTRDSDEYAHGTVAVIRFGVLTERENKEKYADYLDALTDDEREALRVTRNIAAHAGYAKMRDNMFWEALDKHIPAMVAKLRERL